GRTIEGAYLQFTCDETTSDETKVVIHVEDADQSAPFSGAPKNISERPVLEKSIEWKIAKWDKKGRAEGNERSPDVTELVQAIVQRLDWTQGNAISFIITGQGQRVAK